MLERDEVRSKVSGFTAIKPLMCALSEKGCIRAQLLLSSDFYGPSHCPKPQGNLHKCHAVKTSVGPLSGDAFLSMSVSLVKSELGSLVGLSFQ